MTGLPLPTVPDTFELSVDDLLSRTFKLADFGSSTILSLLKTIVGIPDLIVPANRANGHFTSLIQPMLLRAPEVILSAEWDSKADIWNFGCLVRL